MSTTTKERPILFADEMVRAILAGTKTQTRRVVKPQPRGGPLCLTLCQQMSGSWSLGGQLYACPFGVPGDRLWVRESGWERPERTARMMREGADTWNRFYYDADGLDCNDVDFFKRWAFKRRASIHMPRWASRITLEITGVRVERLRDITEADAMAEGVAPYRCPAADALMNAVGGGMKPCPYTSGFANLWNSIAKPGETWDANPWVWVVEFKRINGGAK